MHDVAARVGAEVVEKKGGRAGEEELIGYRVDRKPSLMTVGIIRHVQRLMAARKGITCHTCMTTQWPVSDDTTDSSSTKVRPLTRTRTGNWRRRRPAHAARFLSP